MEKAVNTMLVYKAGDRQIAYVPGFHKLFNISKEVATVVRLLNRKKSVEEVAKISGFPRDRIEEIVRWYESEASSQKPLPSSDNRAKGVSKLVLLTTTFCNLDCRYCYAAGGSYRATPTKMDLGTAERILEYLITVCGFSHIGGITFFGGEPLLNYQAIEFVCHKIVELHNNNSLDALPRFAVITNGTILNGKILNLLRAYNISVTISIDGEKDVHDRLRPYKSGRGSFERVLRNVDELRRVWPDCQLHYEATYTQLHLDKNMNMEDLRRQIEALTGICKGVVIPVMENSSACEDSDWRLKNAADVKAEDVELVWQELSKGRFRNEETVIQFLRQLTNKAAVPRICDFGSSIFAIDPRGDIYPCHMLVGIDGQKIGSVFSEEPIFQTALHRRFSRSIAFVNKDSKKCWHCIARDFCFGCPARWYFESGTLRPPNKFCNSSKKYVMKFLYRLLELRSDPERWRTFLKAFLANDNALS